MTVFDWLFGHSIGMGAASKGFDHHFTQGYIATWLPASPTSSPEGGNQWFQLVRPPILNLFVRHSKFFLLG